MELLKYLHIFLYFLFKQDNLDSEFYCHPTILNRSGAKLK